MTSVDVTAVEDGPELDTESSTARRLKVNWLRDVILGGQDGLVNILCIVLGVIASGGSRARC